MKYDIIFGLDENILSPIEGDFVCLNGNGKINKKRFPDGEWLVTILNFKGELDGKKVLYETTDKITDGTRIDIMLQTLSTLIQLNAKVDVIFNFKNNSKKYREFIKKLIEATGVNILN